jgi:hypothetical protein
MKTQTFVEILTHQIRKELLREMGEPSQDKGSKTAIPAIESANVTQAQQLELWLTLNLKLQTKTHFYHAARSKAAQTKTQVVSELALAQAARPAPQTEPETSPETLQETTNRTERKAYIQTPEQVLAVAFFKREGFELGESYRESELRTAFRKLALKLHPDRHNQKEPALQRDYQERFAKLTECTEILSAALN